MTRYNTHQVGTAGTADCSTLQVGEVTSWQDRLLKTQEVELYCNTVPRCTVLQVGLAVRPTAALLNHSCCPNTVRCSTPAGGLVVLAATDIQVRHTSNVQGSRFRPGRRGGDGLLHRDLGRPAPLRQAGEVQAVQVGAAHQQWGCSDICDYSNIILAQ